jgi:hypothetical protein
MSPIFNGSSGVAITKPAEKRHFRVFLIGERERHVHGLMM